MIYRIVLAHPQGPASTLLSADSIDDAVRQLRSLGMEYTAIEWPAGEGEQTVRALYRSGHKWPRRNMRGAMQGEH